MSLGSCSLTSSAIKKFQFAASRMQDDVSVVISCQRCLRKERNIAILRLLFSPLTCSEKRVQLRLLKKSSALLGRFCLNTKINVLQQRELDFPMMCPFLLLKKKKKELWSVFKFCITTYSITLQEVQVLNGP